MKKPGWVKVIGILFIIIGVYGVGAGAISIKMMPQMSKVMDAQIDALKSSTNDMNKAFEFSAEEQTQVTVKTENPHVDVKDDVVTIQSKESTSHTEVNVTIDGPTSKESADAMNKMKNVVAEEMINTLDSFDFEKSMTIWSYGSIIVSAIFILAGIMLLSVHKHAIMACYSAIGVSLLYNLIPTLFDYELSILSLVLDIIFLVIIVTGEKKVFYPEQEIA